MQEYRKLAAGIDLRMRQLAVEGVPDSALIFRMMAHTTELQRIWTSTTDQQLAILCREYPGFYRYASLILTEEERRTLFGVPEDRDAMVKLYTLSRADLDLVQARRSDANRLGFAVQLVLLRHPGLAPAEIEAPKRLITFLAEQFVDEGLFGEIPPALSNYIDLDAVARDLSCDYGFFRMLGTSCAYRSA